MITIDFMERCHGIKITNDRTYTEVIIHTRNYEQEEEVAIQLIKELVKDAE